MSITPPLGTSVVNFNSSMFWYVISGTVAGTSVSATIYFIKQMNHGYQSPNMKVKIVGTVSRAFSFTFSFANINSATVSQPDPCYLMLGQVGFSWCDTTGFAASFNPVQMTLSFSLVAGTFTIDPTTIGTSTVVDATGKDAQRKVFFDQTRYWAFYSDGTNEVWRTSTDGTTWSGTTTVRAGTGGRYFSTWADVTNHKVYYAYADTSGNNFLNRAGSLNTDGTVTWDYNEVTVSITRTKGGYPTMTLDSGGIQFVALASLRTTGGGAAGNYVEVWKCSTTCGTASNWASSTNFQVNTDTSGVNVGYPIIVPFTSTKLGLVYVKTLGAQMGIKTFSGSAWSSEVLTTSSYTPGSANGVYSMLAISDTMYFAGVDTSNDIRYWSCAYACASAPSETQVTAGTFDTIAISSDGSSELVIAYANSGASTSILYKISSNGGSTWGSEQTLVSSEDLQPVTLTMTYKKGNSVYELLWNSQSGVNVRFAKLTVSQSITVSPSLTESLTPTFKQTVSLKTIALTMALSPTFKQAVSLVTKALTESLTPTFTHTGVFGITSALTESLSPTLKQSLSLSAMALTMALSPVFKQTPSKTAALTESLTVTFKQGLSLNARALTLSLSPTFNQAVSLATRPLTVSLSPVFVQAVSLTKALSLALSPTFSPNLVIGVARSPSETLTSGFNQAVSLASKGLSEALAPTSSPNVVLYIAKSASEALSPVFHQAVGLSKALAESVVPGFAAATGASVSVALSIVLAAVFNAVKNGASITTTTVTLNIGDPQNYLWMLLIPVIFVVFMVIVRRR